MNENYIKIALGVVGVVVLLATIYIMWVWLHAKPKKKSVCHLEIGRASCRERVSVRV